MKRVWAGILIIALMIGIVAPPASVQAAETKYYIKINRQQNCVTVYEKDEKGKYTVPVRAFICSTGANKATPKGVFKLGEKYRWRELDGHVYGQYSARITGHVLFHSVYYHTTDPSTLYYNAYNQLGSAVSHGCVRLCVADAKWIFDNCESGTPIEIYDGEEAGPLGKPAAVKISASHQNRGWDPTDPNPDNPWKLSQPKISGAKNKTVERGAAKAKLLTGVKAVDFAGNSLEVKVTGSYNLNKVGKYKITYKAVDALGKVGKKQVTITVRDTKKPTVSLTQKEVDLTDQEGEFSEISGLEKYLKQFVIAKDSGKLLADKYIHLEAQELWEAWQEKNYGSYQVRVYVTDAAGNRSGTKVLAVHYLEPPSAEEPTEGAEATGTGEQPEDTTESISE